MILTSWQIASTHIERRWWWVRVHSDTAALCRAAHRYAPRHGWGFWDTKLTWACCQPVPPLVPTEEADSKHPSEVIWPGYGFAGVVRLSADHLYPEVIYHEILHAACATYRMNVALDLHLGSGYDDMTREEDLAYIYGQLAADMDTQIKQWCS